MTENKQQPEVAPAQTQEEYVLVPVSVIHQITNQLGTMSLNLGGAVSLLQGSARQVGLPPTPPVPDGDGDGKG